jgi:hypothetical protein
MQASSNDYRRPEDADEQTPAPPWVESDRRPNRASLTTRNGKGDGERHCDHRNRNGEQRCDPGVRQCERDGERQPVRDAQEHDKFDAEDGTFSVVPTLQPLVAVASVPLRFLLLSPETALEGSTQ